MKRSWRDEWTFFAGLLIFLGPIPIFCSVRLYGRLFEMSHAEEVRMMEERDANRVAVNRFDGSISHGDLGAQQRLRKLEEWSATTEFLVLGAGIILPIAFVLFLLWEDIRESLKPPRKKPMR